MSLLTSNYPSFPYTGEAYATEETGGLEVAYRSQFLLTSSKAYATEETGGLEVAYRSQFIPSPLTFFPTTEDFQVPNLS